MKNTGYYTGYSQSGIDEAIENALQQAGEHSRCEIIETMGSQNHLDQKHYQVTVSTYID